MRIGTLELMRVWAALTGIALALWFFAEVWLGHAPNQTLAMLVAAIGGFEVSLIAQDLLFGRHRRRHG